MNSPDSPTLRSAFWYWLKLGCISFGGPAGQIALMHSELVERRRWISERRFLHALNYCMLLPGPEATQLAIYIGWLMHRTWGGIVAGMLFVLPSLALLIGLSWIYMRFGHVPAIAGILAGIKPAIVAVVLAAAWRIGKRTIRHAALGAIAAAAFVGIAVLKLPFPAIIAAAALIGLLCGRWWPPYQAQHGKAQVRYGPALIDDDTPTPAHARVHWQGLAAVLAISILLGLAVWIPLPEPYSTMGAFFTQTAMLAFGGAYAVLPYVVQGAVDTWHWLSAAQMMDGLALGETTPGPLIMVVAFVGYVGGWNAGGAAAGALGACVATFFTFLPSFAFILLGGPVVESTRDDVRFNAVLTAITAAVVGVIASLALLFGEQVFRQQGAWNLPALGLCAAACLALFHFQVGTIKTIAACALAGLLLSYGHA